MICILFLFLCQTVSSHFHLLRVGAGCSTLQFPENYLYRFKFAIFLPTNFPEEPKIDFHTPYYVSKEWSDWKSKSILKEGDVLIVQTGDIGQVAAVTKEYEGCNCHALIIVSTNDQIDGFYLSWVLNTGYGFHSLKSIQTGALHPHLNCDAIRTIKATVPPHEEQIAIKGYVELQNKQFGNLINYSESMIVLLKERRTALISAAVTGKIDARNFANG